MFFVYTALTEGFEGVRTWTSFSSKEDFDAERHVIIDGEKYMYDGREKVVAEGLSNEECKQLCRQTPRACRVAAAFQRATGPRGAVSPEILAMELFGLGLAEAEAEQIERMKKE
ncbi:MAG: hypothetical protein NTY66_00190 [Candidatus Vogelbacteria bacterium]|nr:hypothetical protein [Candidatus Vogelbacteria bacterium]